MELCDDYFPDWNYFLLFTSIILPDLPFCSFRSLKSVDFTFIHKISLTEYLRPNFSHF